MTNNIRHATIIDDAQVYTDWEPPRLRPGDAMTAGLGALLRRVAARTGTREGVAILTGMAAADAEIPTDPNHAGDTGHVVAQLRAAGWSCGSDNLRPWQTLEADGLPLMYLGIEPWFSDFAIGVKDSPTTFDWRATADALGLWWELTGSAYFYSPGVAALNALQDMVRAGRIKPKWKADPVCGGEERRWAPWVGPHIGPEPAATWVYDKRRAGLAALASAEVCVGNLRHTGRRQFDRRLAGWWQIEVPAWNDDRLPDPCGPYADRGGVAWFTTPTVALLEDLAAQGRSAGIGVGGVLDSYTGPGRRLFRYWAQRMEQAYQFAAALENPTGDAVADAVKRGAAREAHGMMASGRGAVQREDWHHTVTAVKRASIFRVADAQLQHNAEAVPLLIDDDAITYGDALHGLHVPVGTSLGQFDLERMVL